MNKFFVTMTDSFLSGWGNAENRHAKYVYECESFIQASIVSDNAKARKDQKYVNICTTKPNYPVSTHLTQIKTKEDCPNWYTPNFF